MIKDSILEHVDELRQRGLKSLLAWVVCCFGLFPFMDVWLEILIRPIGQVIFISPASAFMAEIKLTLLAGFLIASPIIFYQVWRFLSSGLKPHERKFVRFFGPLSLVCYLLGTGFAYFIAVPFSLQFFLGFGSPNVLPMITIENYIGFLMSMFLAFGCVFEMPLILVFLTVIGVATPAFLIQKRRHAIIFLLILSAFITPPDILSLCIMTGPLILLYEVGIWASKLTVQKKLQFKN